MVLMILRDANGHEIGRDLIDPKDRYDLYERYQMREGFDFRGITYRLVSVAWRMPEQELILQVIAPSAPCEP